MNEDIDGQCTSVDINNAISHSNSKSVPLKLWSFVKKKKHARIKDHAKVKTCGCTGLAAYFQHLLARSFKSGNLSQNYVLFLPSLWFFLRIQFGRYPRVF